MKAFCKRLVSLLLVLSMVVSLVPAVFAAEDAVTTISGNVKRIAGADRIGTSLGIADQLKEALGGGQFGTVVVASALNFPDALTGSYLAAKENAPILLTYEAADAKVLQYVKENLAPGGMVYILGGYTAVSAGFENSLTASGINFERLAGTDRFGTNIKIMEKAGDYAGKPVLIATAINFADSLSASAAGLPMVLVHGSLKPEQKEFLAKTSGQFVIIGGTSAVSPALENELKAFGSVERLAGNGRYQTSVMVAQRFIPNHDSVVLAYARNFPDGLCAGPLAYALGAPLILTDNYDPREADNYVTGINTGFVVGGASLISDVAARAIFDLGNGGSGEDPVDYFTVTFESNGGSAVQAQVVEEGKPAEKPADPTRRGFAFDGWYSDAALTTAYDFATPVTGDMTLYAAWREVGRHYYVTFESNGGPVVAPQSVPEGSYAAIPDIPVWEGHAFAGWYTSNSFDSYFEFLETPIVENITVYARWLDTDDDTDTDGDGLTDVYEDYFETDPTKQDTDGDGLTDYLELLLLDLDPLNTDTDGDSIPDGDEDTDSDSLTNLEELTLGTAPYLSDTDADGLKDKEESGYSTDPNKEDTDADGVSDGKEVELGTDPLTPDETFSMKVSANDSNSNVSASVDIVLSGEQVESLHVGAVEDDIFFPKTMPGYMGDAFEFRVDGTFESATIHFTFDASALPADAEPTIYYFNEETQELEELATSISGNVASTVVTHFSKYILVDRHVYEESFSWQDTWENEKTYTSAEIVMVFDDSGSLGGDYGYDASTGYFLGGNDPEHKRLEVARTFVDSVNNTFKIGIVKFDGIVDLFTPNLVVCDAAGKASLKNMLHITPITDNSVAYNAPGIFDSRGYTEMYTGINAAFNLFSTNSGEGDSILRAMIVFTDGMADDTSMHSSTVTTANNLGIRIYTVGLGSSTNYFTRYLEPLAVNTGAKFYYTSNADQLADIYKDIGEKIDIEKDSDNDGIPDFYEDNMILFNGVSLQTDKNNPDSDGDGIKDGDEVEIQMEFNADRTKVKVTGKLVLGHPKMKDTDGDGLYDKEDSRPFKWDISDRDLAMLAQICYEDIPSGTRIDTLASTYPSYASNITSAFKGAATLEELKGWEVFTTHYSKGGLQIAVYEKDNQLVFACRGSEDKSIWYKSAEFWKDWVIADGLGWLTGINAQAPAAKSFVKKVMNQNKSYDVYITGHSLGGNVAYNLGSKAFDVGSSRVKKLNTYNGLGLLFGITLGITDWVDEYRLVNNSSKLTDYHIEGDPVFPLSPFHYGTHIKLSLCQGAYGAHDLYSFLVHLPRHKSTSGGGGSW